MPLTQEDLININPHLQGRPINKEPYSIYVYGADGIYEVETRIVSTYGVLGGVQKKIYGKYTVARRYTGGEPTIEDVYTYSTKRYMDLPCLRGPLFPYYTDKGEVAGT